MNKKYLGSMLFCLSNALIATSFASSNTCIKNLKDAESEFISLRNCHITTADVPDVLAYVKKNPIVTALDLGQNQLDDDSGKLFAADKQLKYLLLDANRNFGNRGATDLAATTTLYGIGLDDTKVGDAGVTELSKNQHLTYLTLNNDKNITHEGIKQLGQNSKIRSLAVANINLNDDDATQLANIANLYLLFASDNKIGNAGVKDLTNNPSLHQLALNNNRVGDEGAMAIANNENMEVVLLAHNPIGASGLLALSNPKSTQIVALDLSNNHVTDNPAESIATIESLQVLALDHNDITDVGAYAFARTTTLKLLYIRYNHLTQKGIDALNTNEELQSFTDGNNGKLKLPQALPKLPKRSLASFAQPLYCYDRLTTFCAAIIQQALPNDIKNI